MRAVRAFDRPIYITWVAFSMANFKRVRRKFAASIVFSKKSPINSGKYVFPLFWFSNGLRFLFKNSFCFSLIPKFIKQNWRLKMDSDEKCWEYEMFWNGICTCWTVGVVASLKPGAPDGVVANGESNGEPELLEWLSVDCYETIHVKRKTRERLQKPLMKMLPLT